METKVASLGKWCYKLYTMFKHLFTSLFLQDLSELSLMQKFTWRFLVLLELDISYIYFFYCWFSILIVKLVVKEWPNQSGDPCSIPRGFESKKFWITYFWLYKAQISAYLDQLSWMNWMNSVFVIYLDILIYMFCFKFMEFAICFSNRKRWSCSA